MAARRKDDVIDFTKPLDPLAGLTTVVSLGPEAELRFNFREVAGSWAPKLASAVLALRRARGHSELVDLPGASWARIEQRVEQDETGKTCRETSLRVSLEDDAVTLGGGGISEIVEGWDGSLPLGGQAVQSALRMLRSLAAEPSLYGATKSQLDSLLDARDAAGLVRLLPLDRVVGQAKRSLPADDRDRVLWILEGGESKLLAWLVLGCATPERATISRGVRLPAGVWKRIDQNAAAQRVSAGEYLAQLVEAALDGGLS